MKIFNKIKIGKKFTSRIVLEVIDQKKRNLGLFFRQTPPGGARGRIGPKFKFNVNTKLYIPNGSS